MKIYRNNISRLIAAIFCVVVVLKGKHHIATFFEVIFEPDRSRHEPQEVLIGGMLFIILMLAVVGFFRIFFDRN